MQALLAEWHLTTPLFRFLFPQILVLTILVRLAVAGLWRVIVGLWSTPVTGIVLCHGAALVIFAACNNFVDAGAPPETMLGSLVHSISVLWLMQLFVLIPDLLVHLIRRRPAAA